MSWTGTVRCGHCYEKGHNKRSCPALKKLVEDNPEGYHARIQNMRSPAKKRRCTYCNLTGHNRRTCSFLTEDKTTWKTKCLEWRNEWAEWMAEIGLVPGALVKCNVGYQEEGVRILKGFNYNSMNHEAQQEHYPHQALSIARLTAPTRGTGNLRLPRHDKLVPHACEAFEVVGPVKITAAQILEAAPSWFREGTGHNDLDDVFDKDRTHADWHTNGYNERD